MTQTTRSGTFVLCLALAVLVTIGGVAGTAVAAAQTGAAAPAGPTAAAEQVAPRTDCEFDRVYDKAIRSVVTVRVFTDRGDVGLGSGWVYERSDGEVLVVTNQHVIDNAYGADVRFADGEWRNVVELVGVDPYADLAVLRVPDAPAYAEPLAVSGERPDQGDAVAALGSPLGLEGTISTGVVSAVDRSVTVGTGSGEVYAVADAVQTDAAVNPGNSGGPLVGCDGRVVGVNFAGVGPDVGDTINFAISAAMVRRIVPELVSNGTYLHSYMGIRARTLSPTLARINGLDATTGGVLVETVVSGAPADGVLEGSPATDRVTTLPVGGDAIVAVDGTPIGDVDELRDYLFEETRPGETVTVTVVRDGQRRNVTLTLTAQPLPRERVGFDEPSI